MEALYKSNGLEYVTKFFYVTRVVNLKICIEMIINHDKYRVHAWNNMRNEIIMFKKQEKSLKLYDGNGKRKLKKKN